MKWVLICLGLAVASSSFLVSVVLYHEIVKTKVDERVCRSMLGELYEVALEQNNALNSCVGELEAAQECLPRLEHCLGVK